MGIFWATSYEEQVRSYLSKQPEQTALCADVDAFQSAIADQGTEGTCYARAASDCLVMCLSRIRGSCYTDHRDDIYSAIVKSNYCYGNVFRSMKFIIDKR